MAKIVNDIIGKIGFRFTVSVKDLIENDKGILSPDIIVSNLPWKVKLETRTVNIENTKRDVIGIYLILISENTKSLPKEWSVEASCIFNLIPFKNNQIPFMRELTKTQYRSDKITKNGLAEFILLDEILKPDKFVYNDEIIIEGDIFAGPIKTYLPPKFEVTGAQFRFIIQGVSKLDHEFSHDVMVRGLNWSVNAEKDVEHLGLYLYVKQSTIDENWSFDVECTFKLLSFDASAATEVKTFTNISFHRNRLNWGFPKFILWEDLLKPEKKYIMKDEVTIDVSFKVAPSRPAWNWDEPLKKTKPSGSHCPICFESFSDCEISATACGHLFCKLCIKKTIEQLKKCAICNAPVAFVDLRSIFLSS